MSNIFAWNNYEENPNNMIGVDTIRTQKHATYNEELKGAFNGNALDSFFTNNDEYAYPQSAAVKGTTPMEIVYGKGCVAPAAVIPSDYDVVTDPASIPTEGTTTVKLAVSGDDVANAMTSGNVFEDIIVTEANVNTNVKFYAENDLTIDNIVVSGDKGSSNGKITYAAKDVTIKNVTIGPDVETTTYNMFEGYQETGDNARPLETMTVQYVNIDNPDITHNVVNVYTPGEGCVINIKDSNFNLDVNNSNVLRLSNTLNSSNVTVNFENVEWTYENAAKPNSDWNWAGLVIYQPYGKDNAYKTDSELTEIKTWKFNFTNCRYNGERITGNNFGEHNQAVYMYDLKQSGTVSDPAGIFTMKFN